MRRDEAVLEILKGGPKKSSTISEDTGMRVKTAICSLLKYKCIKVVSGRGTSNDPRYYALWDWQGPVQLNREAHLNLKEIKGE